MEKEEKETLKYPIPSFLQKKIYERADRIVCELHNKYILKVRSFRLRSLQSPYEANTLRFIQENVSISVPNIICSWDYDSRSYVITEKIEGKTLESQWRSMNSEQRTSILEQLKQYIKGMKKSEFNYIGSVGNNSGYEFMISEKSSFECYKTLKEINYYRLNELILDDPKLKKGVFNLVQSDDLFEIRFVLSHTDLGL